MAATTAAAAAVSDADLLRGEMVRRLVPMGRPHVCAMDPDEEQDEEDREDSVSRIAGDDVDIIC